MYHDIKRGGGANDGMDEWALLLSVAPPQPMSMGGKGSQSVSHFPFLFYPLSGGGPPPQL